MTPHQVSARQLFEHQRERLGLRWLAGQRGAGHTVGSSAHRSRRPSLVGYLNVIHPNKVQILGREELAWLDGLDPRQRWETLHRIMGLRPLALVITRDQGCPSDLREAAEETGIPLWTSSQPGHELLTQFQYYLSRTLASRVTVHGVFMEIHSIGVLITGESGLGKSELALELVSRGHRLIADDAPEFIRVGPDLLEGSCPELLQDLMEVRGLGIMNIRQMFGDTAVMRSKHLRLILNLVRAGETDNDAMSRLTGETAAREVLGLSIPVINLPVAVGRNLAVLSEAAARLHILRDKGDDPAAAFLARHSALLGRTQA